MRLRVQKYFQEQLIGRHLPFDYRMFMIFFLEALVLSVLAALTHTLLGKHVIWGVFLWTVAVVMFAMLLGSVKLRRDLAKPSVLFFAFVYVPILFFQTGGYHGTAAYFALITMLVITLLFSGKMRKALVALLIVVWLGCSVVCFVRPEWVVPQGDALSQFVDFIVVITLALSGIAILGQFYKTQFDLETDRITRLNGQLESSNARLRDLAVRDALTLTYNRSYLYKHLEDKLNLLAKDGPGYQLMMLDVDGFKSINDTYGHMAGDAVIKQLATAIMSVVREDDVIIRFGGDEFLVVLLGANMLNAEAAAQRVMNIIALTAFPNEIALTASIGLVQAQKGERFDDLFKRIEKCVYQAKLQGSGLLVTEADIAKPFDVEL